MSETKGFFGVYKPIGAKYPPTNGDSNHPTFLNDNGIKLALEGNYTVAMEKFNEAISMAERKSDYTKYVPSIYHNRAMVSIESGLFDFAESLGLINISAGNFDEFRKKFKDFNKLLDFLASLSGSIE